MSADTFLERLCSLVPREREHAILYRGTLGPHSKRRVQVVPEQDTPRPTNLTWAVLMQHGLALDVLACACGVRMKFIAVAREKQSLARLLLARGEVSAASRERGAKAMRRQPWGSSTLRSEEAAS